MVRELGRTERKAPCTSVLDTRGSWGGVGLVLREEGMLWRSKAQLIRVYVELLQIQLRCATASRQPTQETRS